MGDLWYVLECEDGVLSSSWGNGLGLAVAPPAAWGGCQESPGLTVPHLSGKGDLQPQLDNALQDVNDMYLLLEETEKQAVRKALIEERGRFCTFITFLQPVVVSAGARRVKGCSCCPVDADALSCVSSERRAHHAGRDHPPAGYYRGPGGAHC